MTTPLSLSRYDIAMGHLEKFAPRDKIEKILSFNCIMERVNSMDQLIVIMQDLWIQFNKNKKEND